MYECNVKQEDTVISSQLRLYDEDPSYDRP